MLRSLRGAVPEASVCLCLCLSVSVSVSVSLCMCMQVKNWLVQEVDMQKEDAAERADKLKRKAAARAQVAPPSLRFLSPHALPLLTCGSGSVCGSHMVGRVSYTKTEALRLLLLCLCPACCVLCRCRT